MPIHLQEPDKEMCLAHLWHKTPELFLGVHAAESLPTHTSQHLWAQLGPGAEAAGLLWNWASLLLCCGTFWSSLPAAAQTDPLQWPEGPCPDSSEKPSSPCIHFCLPSLQWGNEGHFLHRTAIFFRHWEGTRDLNVTVSLGGSTPILPGGKKKKAFFLAPARSHVWNSNHISIVFFCIVPHWLPRWLFFPHSWHYWNFVVFK